MIIKNEKLGITSDQISSVCDVSKLIGWSRAIGEEIVLCSTRMNKLHPKISKDREAEIQYYKTKTYKELQELLQKKINNRVADIEESYIERLEKERDFYKGKLDILTPAEDYEEELNHLLYGERVEVD